MWTLVQCEKPDLQLFQTYFANQVKAISASGLHVKVRAIKKKVKVTVLNLHGHLADLVVKALSLNFRQFNGHFGCSICLHPGERTAKGKGTVQIYPVPESRNILIDQARLAQAMKKIILWCSWHFTSARHTLYTGQSHIGLYAFRACLYERRDGTFAGTGRCPGSRHVYVSIVFIAYCLYGGGTFFVPSRLGGIPVSATGIPA